MYDDDVLPEGLSQLTVQVAGPSTCTCISEQMKVLLLDPSLVSGLQSLTIHGSGGPTFRFRGHEVGEEVIRQLSNASFWAALPSVWFIVEFEDGETNSVDLDDIETAMYEEYQNKLRESGALSEDEIDKLLCAYECAFNVDVALKALYDGNETVLGLFEG